jgi:hypothetical protein
MARVREEAHPRGDEPQDPRGQRQVQPVHDAWSARARASGTPARGLGAGGGAHAAARGPLELRTVSPLDTSAATSVELSHNALRFAVQARVRVRPGCWPSFQGQVARVSHDALLYKISKTEDRTASVGMGCWRRAAAGRARTLPKDGAQVPGVGHAAGDHAVLGQRDHGAVVEHRQQHDQQRREVPARAAADDGMLPTGNSTALYATCLFSLHLQSKA